MQHTFALGGASIALVLGAAVAVPASVNTSGNAIPFDAFSMKVAINSTDLDSGVEFFSDTGERLQHLWLQDPNGRIVFQLTASDPDDLGLTEIFWETSEPDIPSALSAYPPGQYTLSGIAFDGTRLESTTLLTHQMAVRPEIFTPMEGDMLDINNVIVTWRVDSNVAFYIVEVSSEDFQTKNTINLKPGVTSFQIPPELIEADSEVKVEVAAVLPSGNLVFAEVEFDTLP